MDFQFAPWERLTSEVTDGAADLRLDVGGKTWLYRQCGALHFVRPLERNCNYLIRPVISPLNLSDEKLWQETDADRLPLVLNHKESRERMLGRYWQLETNVLATWCASDGWYLHRDINHFIAREAGPYYRSPMLRHVRQYAFDDAGIPLRFPDAKSDASSAIFAALRKDCENSASDLYYSAGFLKLSRPNRALLGVKTRVGTSREWAAIVAATARACGAQWPDDIEKTRLHFCSDGTDQRFTCEDNRIFGVRERTILDYVMRICKPRQINDKKSLPSALRLVTEGGWSRNFSVEIARPSRHGQIEAALELRAWLQARWPVGLKHLDEIV